MCDYSLMHLKSRPAKVGDKLTSGAIPGDHIHPSYATKGLFDANETGTAVCLIPGTEVAFAGSPVTFLGVPVWRSRQSVATFRQIDKQYACTHHDAFEFKSGEVKLVNQLEPGQKLTVLQLPAAPKTEGEAKEQERVAVIA